MGQVGTSADNAVMESFFALLQKNVLDRRRWASRKALRITILTWLRKALRITILTWLERTYHTVTDARTDSGG